jgi:hypothetical protein
MADYCELKDVERALRASFTSSTVPSVSDVEAWISESTELINEYAHRSYNQVSIEDETHDYFGEGVLTTKVPGLVSVSKVEFSRDGGSSWITIDPSSYVVDSTYDEVILRSRPGLVAPSIPGGLQSVRISYVAGPESVPKRIKLLCVDMVVLRVIYSELSRRAKSVGGNLQAGPFRLSSPGTFSTNYYNRLDDSIMSRLDSLSSSRIATTPGKSWRF